MVSKKRPKDAARWAVSARQCATQGERPHIYYSPGGRDAVVRTAHSVLHWAEFGQDPRAAVRALVRHGASLSPRIQPRHTDRAGAAWSVFPGSRFVGHPPTGAPNFGVVDVSSVVYAAPLVRSLEDAHDAADPLYRLNTDACNSVCVLICLFQRVTADFSIYVKSEIG